MCRPRWRRDWRWTSSLPRLSFFFNAHNNFLEEVAKFRAARRMWARIMRERFAAKNPKSQMLRFHTQTAGSTLTAQQPENNIVRTSLQAMAAVLGGTQSLHTNGFDEALALPTERAARIALRTQQIIAYESGAPQTVDPLAGSYYIESLTDELERIAEEYIAKIDAMGGTIAAVERGYIQGEIQNAAYAFQRAVDLRGAGGRRGKPVRHRGRRLAGSPEGRSGAGAGAGGDGCAPCVRSGMRGAGKRRSSGSRMRRAQATI